jgi:hypothetical protein
MRCFLHVVNDAVLVRDAEGEEFSELEAAAQEAAQLARDLMAEELRQGKPLPVRWRVLLTTADDTVLLSLPFTHLIPSAEPSPQYVRSRAEQYEVMEREHLSDADRHILHVRARVEVQKGRISQMQQRGEDTSGAEDLLRLFEATLGLFISHRQIILQALHDHANPMASGNVA